MATGTSIETDKHKVAWIPLESNPDVMTEYSRLLGAAKGTWLAWLDVFGFDDESLACIPQPVVAVVFLFATNTKFDQDIIAEDERERVRPDDLTQPAPDPSLYFMKQTIENACGAIAVIHSLTNNVQELAMAEDSPLKAFIDTSIDLTPGERGKKLEESEEIEALHHAMAAAGQTDVPGPNDPIEPHFVAFVQKEGSLYELDGCRPGPIHHGETSSEGLLKDTVKICEKRMEEVQKTTVDTNTNNEEYRFAVFALTTADYSD